MLADELDELIELQALFAAQGKLAETGTRLGLYHATRAMFDLQPATHEGLGQQWDEFLADETAFEFSCDELVLARAQHSCFYGARYKLNDFTALAANAIWRPCGNVPKSCRRPSQVVVFLPFEAFDKLQTEPACPHFFKPQVRFSRMNLISSLNAHHQSNH